MDWLSKIDHNAVLGVLTVVAGWFYSAKKADKEAKLSQLIWAALRQEVQRLFADPKAPELARTQLTLAAWGVLERIGLKRSKALEPFVARGVEHGLAELEEWLGVQRLLTERLSRVNEAAARVEAAFEPPTSPTVPRLDLTGADDPEPDKPS